MIGRTLSHFNITAKLGEGGMGEVYRAEDSKLGREVAIKVLPEAFTADEERLARFEREARVLASLNHSNIAAIFEVGEENKSHFLVMELAQGETLAERIVRGAIPVDDAIAIALQLAEGLEAAHEQGIVHRDLKPANIKIHLDAVKILDFGLAKAWSEEAGPTPDLSISPTLTAQMTQAGVILGTPAYMSPEQARGQEVDKRTDIWAFGVVLFEMLTGERCFDGQSVTDVLAAVVGHEPDWEKLPAETPATVRRLLLRCLTPEPARRLRDIGDARFELEAAQEGGEEAAVSAAATSPVRRLAPWFLIPLAIVVGFALRPIFRGGSDRASVPEVVHSAIELPEGVRLAGWSSPAVAISPDERTIAFVGHHDGRQELYLRRLDGPEAVAVPRSDGAEGPFFSPDSRWVGFGAGGISGRSNEPRLLKRAPVDGGATQDIVALTDYAGGSWGEDGFIYYVDGFMSDSLLRVPEEGGEAESAFAQVENNPLSRRVVVFPQHLPGGRRLLVTALREGEERLLVLDLETGEAEDLGQKSTYSRYSPSGHLVFVDRDRVLRAAPFDPVSGKLAGTPVAVLRDIALTANDAPVLAIGGHGTAVYATGFVRGSTRVLNRVVRIDRKGMVEHLPVEADTFLVGPSFSPDGERFVVGTWEGGLWIYDLTRGTRLRLPDEGLREKRGALWSPDGKTIVFSAEQYQREGIILAAQAADGTGSVRELVTDAGEAWAKSFTPDGRHVIFARWFSEGTEWDGGLYRVPVSGEGEPELVLAGANHDEGALSPDGRWIAYQTEETGRREIYLQPYPEGGAVIPVSRGGGFDPRWAPSGEEIVYWSGCQLMSVSFRTEPTLRLGSPVALFEHCGPQTMRHSHYEMDADGSIYMLEAVPESGIVTSLELVLGWAERLEGGV